MLIFPFVWAIKMLIASKEKKEILREDYDRRAWIDASIRRLFPITNNNDEIESQRRKIWADYIAHWAHHSPAEMLLYYRSNDKSANAQPVGVLINDGKKNYSKSE